MENQTRQSIITGIMITSAGSIGAGMFSLPVKASGMWFLLSLVVFVIIWFVSYLSALYILEVNVRFEPGASFDTMVKNTLGQTWNVLMGISVAFLLYILLYAYFSGFGNMAAYSLGIEAVSENRWLQGLASLILGGLLAAIVWASTAVVGRICTLLVIGMGIAYLMSMAGLALQVEATKLFDLNSTQNNYFTYIWAALPYFMTSFGFSSLVPSLYKHYGKQPQLIQKSVLYGSLAALVVYTIFIFVAFGNISRYNFIAINEAGGNMGDLVAALEQNSQGSLFGFMLNLFSNFAIISSFLGVGLGLFDYMADRFSFPDTAKGRFYTACITFLPPGIACFFFPKGFITAIGFAGLVLIFSFSFIPFLMVNKTRNEKRESLFRVKGGKGLLYFFIGVSFLVAMCQILSMLGYLPKW